MLDSIRGVMEMGTLGCRLFFARTPTRTNGCAPLPEISSLLSMLQGWLDGKHCGAVSYQRLVGCMHNCMHMSVMEIWVS